MCDRVVGTRYCHSSAVGIDASRRRVQYEPKLLRLHHTNIQKNQDQIFEML
jgi:hypothetical protein